MSLPAFWYSEYVPCPASVNLWIPTSGWHKKPKARTEARTLGRLCAETRTFRAAQWFPGEFHLQLFAGSLCAAASHSASGQHTLESPRAAVGPALSVLGTPALAPRRPGKAHFLAVHVLSPLPQVVKTVSSTSAVDLCGLWGKLTEIVTL